MQMALFRSSTQGSKSTNPRAQAQVHLPSPRLSEELSGLTLQPRALGVLLSLVSSLMHWHKILGEINVHALKKDAVVFTEGMQSKARGTTSPTLAQHGAHGERSEFEVWGSEPQVDGEMIHTPRESKIKAQMKADAWLSSPSKNRERDEHMSTRLPTKRCESPQGTGAQSLPPCGGWNVSPRLLCCSLISHQGAGTRR